MKKRFVLVILLITIVCLSAAAQKPTTDTDKVGPSSQIYDGNELSVVSIAICKEYKTALEAAKPQEPGWVIVVIKLKAKMPTGKIKLGRGQLVDATGTTFQSIGKWYELRAQPNSEATIDVLFAAPDGTKPNTFQIEGLSFDIRSMKPVVKDVIEQ